MKLASEHAGGLRPITKEIKDMLYFISRLFYVCGPEDDVIWKVETPINSSLDTVRSFG